MTENIEIFNKSNTNPFSINEIEDNNSEVSLLTPITDRKSDSLVNESICNHLYQESNNQIFEDDTFHFKPNKNSGNKEYMEIIETDKCYGWEKYCRECYKFSIPKISEVKDILDGKIIKFDMSNYIPQSIGIMMSMQIFCDAPQPLLTHINFTNSPFTESGCYTLSEFIGSSSTLQHLNLTNCRIGYKGIQILEEGLFDNSSLIYINLSGCHIRDHGGVIVAKALLKSSTCHTLDLSHNFLYSESCDKLAELVVYNSVIETLELGWNNMYPPENMRKFLNGLAKNTNLKKLGLSWNGLSGDYFGIALKKVLVSHPSLEIINLENNRLTAIGQLIGVGLLLSPSMHNVYLGGNPWTTDDYMFLVKIFFKGPRVTFMSLGGDTYVIKEVTQLVQRAKAVNPNIKIIYKGTMCDTPAVQAEFRPILIDRMRALAMKPKKKKLKRDMGVFFNKIKNDKDLEPQCTHDEFVAKCRAFAKKLDKELLNQICEDWQTKSKKVALLEMAEYYLSRHPLTG